MRAWDRVCRSRPTSRPGTRPGHERVGRGASRRWSPGRSPTCRHARSRIAGRGTQRRRSIDAFSAAIVRGKVRTPTLRPTTLERPRLLNWLEEHADQRVRVITAEAGYGKSTLLADHAKRSGRRVAWYPAGGDRRGLGGIAQLRRRELSARSIPDFGVGRGQPAAAGRRAECHPRHGARHDPRRAGARASPTRSRWSSTTSTPSRTATMSARSWAGCIELAPPSVHFVISGRRHPGSLLARPSSQGRWCELGTEELRFTRTEAGHLLANILGTPLDDDLVAILDDRLAGWGASLQLVGTSLVGTATSRRCACSSRSSTSRSEPLYDFLAEHVLGRQPAPLRRLLSVASILERIEPSLLMAAMSGEAGASARRVAATLAQAEDAGVISRASSGGRWWRLHPLVRDFMLSRLLENTGSPALMEMHHRVAQAAERLDWAVAAHHYIEAERQEDAMRVLRESAIEALGTASWGAATALADRMPDQPVPEAVVAIRAIDMVARAVRHGVRCLARRPHTESRRSIGLGTHEGGTCRMYTSCLATWTRSASGRGHERIRRTLPARSRVAGRGFRCPGPHPRGRPADASEVLEHLAHDHARPGLAPTTRP